MQRQINLSVKLPPTLRREVELSAASQGINMSDWVRTVLAAAVHSRIIVVANEAPAFPNEQPEPARAG